MGRYLKGSFPLGSVLCTYERPLEIQYNTIQYNRLGKYSSELRTFFRFLLFLLNLLCQTSRTPAGTYDIICGGQRFVASRSESYQADQATRSL